MEPIQNHCAWYADFCILEYEVIIRLGYLITQNSRKLLKFCSYGSQTSWYWNFSIVTSALSLNFQYCYNEYVAMATIMTLFNRVRRERSKKIMLLLTWNKTGHHCEKIQVQEEHLIPQTHCQPLIFWLIQWFIYLFEDTMSHLSSHKPGCHLWH